MENFRRAIGLRIKEVKEVYEGEVRTVTEGDRVHWANIVPLIWEESERSVIALKPSALFTGLVHF